MVLIWWCVAGALYAVGAALFRRGLVMLAAANPRAPVPWIGWPDGFPRGARVLVIGGTGSSVLAMNCVLSALGRHHLYDVRWNLPFILVVLVVALAPQIEHNRRVRRAA